MSFFCPDPYNRISTTTNGYWKACCIATPSDMHIDDTKFLDFVNSDYMQTLREHQKLGLMSGVVSQTCKKCIHNERTAGKSRRTELLQSPYDLDTIENIKIKHIGNLCNLKCVMCFPSESSLFAQEAIALGEHDGDIVVKQDLTDTYLEGLAEVLPRVKEIRLVGGEPIVNPMTWKFIEWLRDGGFSHLSIHFTTNGTRSFTKEQKTLLEYFSSVAIIFSLDAIGKRNDYIRFPSNFESLMKNFDDMKSFASHLNVNATITMLNLGYIDELVEYFPDTYVEVGNGITNPEILRPENIPYEIKETYKSKIPSVQKLLQVEPNHENFMRGLIHLKKRDVHRGNNLLDLWPEFKPYYPIAI